MGFTGFPEEALDFYEGLEADNSKSYWTDHRHVYDNLVLAPMQALLEELAPEFGTAKVFRPYRDVRFSKDKTPYKTAIAAVVGDGDFYVHLSTSGLLVGGGAYGLATDQARRLRSAIADDLPGRELAKLLDGLRAKGLTVEGDRLKRVPPEFGADHPRADLLTLKSLWARKEIEPSPLLHSPKLKAAVVTALRQIQPLNAWVDQHVRPSRT